MQTIIKYSFQYLLLFVILHRAIGLTYAQENLATDISSSASHPLKIYTNKDGLPQNAIISMAVDSIGKLWVGTQDGAAYYNGRIWKTVNVPGHITSNYIQTIKVAHDGAIWFGVLRDGIYRYKDDKWEYWGVKEGLPSNYILRIYEQISNPEQSIIWVGTNNGAARYINGKWEIFSEADNSELTGNIIYDIYETTDGKIWFTTNKGISVYYNDTWEIVTIPFNLKQKQIYRIMQSRDGAMWFGGDGILLKFMNNSWQLFSFKGSGTSDVVNAIFQSKKGDVWLGTHSGVFNIEYDVISNKESLKFVNLRSNSQKKDEILVWCIGETSDGSLWFGTFLGLFRYIEGKWQSVTKYMDVERGGTNCIWEKSCNEFWFGTENGLVTYQNGVWSSKKNISGSILALFKSSDGAMWVSVLFKGVHKYQNNKWTTFTRDNGLAENSNWFIYQTSDGAMWFGSDAGVAKYKNNNWQKFTKADGLADNTVLCMLERRDSSLWFGTTSGITVFKDGKQKKITTQDGLSGNVISAIFENSDSNENANGIWFATMGGGVSKFNPESGKWQIFNSNTIPKLSNNSVYRIEKDKKGRLYFLTSNMITRFTFLNTGQIVTDIFSTEDGLPNNEGISSASFVDCSGRIWMGTTEGAAFYDPDTEASDHTQKTVIIENISIPNFPTNKTVESNISLSHNQNNLLFEFALLSFFREHETTYSTQLIGYDAEPSIWKTDYKKEYTNLPDGSFIFKVWGKDYAGNISSPVEFSFHITPPWWKTWWFQVLSLLLFLVLIYVSVKIIIARKEKKQLAILEKKQLIERERFRISKDMHDTIGSSLTRIAMLSDRVSNSFEGNRNVKDETNTIKTRINSIGLISREIIDEMNEIIWSLSPKHDDLNSLIFYLHHYINKMLEQTTIKTNFNFPESTEESKLSPEVRRNIFLIFKEAVNNLVKYSKASTVFVSFFIENKKLMFEIKDDGVGFSESYLPNKKVPRFGLSNMKERANSIGALLTVESMTGKGTSIKFSIKLE